MAGSFFVACPDLRTDDLRNNWEVAVQNYDIRYDDKHGQLAQIDIAAEGEGYEPWVNQTLTSVNDCVVRLAVIEGELVDWHSHETKTSSFSCSREGSSSRSRGGTRSCLVCIRA
jgi:hypothetical protein